MTMAQTGSSRPPLRAKTRVRVRERDLTKRQLLIALHSAKQLSVTANKTKTACQTVNTQKGVVPLHPQALESRLCWQGYWPQEMQLAILRKVNISKKTVGKNNERLPMLTQALSLDIARLYLLAC